MRICAVFCVFVSLALGSPVPPNTQPCECSAAARSLLSNLSHIMQKEGKMEHRDLFAGFNCTDLEAQMIPHTLTASVCQPSASDEFAECLMTAPPTDRSVEASAKSQLSALLHIHYIAKSIGSPPSNEQVCQKLITKHQ